MNMNSNNTVLLADDDPALLRALKIRLERLGLQVVTATDGYSSLALAMRVKPRLLILDVNMPAGDGFTVQERLRQTDLLNVPVIYLTGDESARLDTIAQNLGAVSIHHKPFQLSDLIEDIRRVFRPRAA
jgi:DNA-binding response OmpR family regulator